MSNIRAFQWDLFYAIVVAGKTAAFATAATRRVIEAVGDTPLFDWVRLRSEADVEQVMRQARTGNYGKIGRALRFLCEAQIDLAVCGPADLEQVPGIGPKTSRFFILRQRPDSRYAALDVHVLRWMRDQGYDAPKSTPQGKAYDRLEQQFLAEADARGLLPGQLDWLIWDAAHKRPS